MNFKQIFTVISVSTVLSLCSVEEAYSAQITIRNPSFELPRLNNGGFTTNTIPHWNLNQGNSHSVVGVFNPVNQFSVPVPDGENTAYINYGSFSQILAENLRPNTIYTLSTFVGNRHDVRLNNFTVDLLAGENLLAQGTNSDVNIPQGRFALLSFSFNSMGSAFVGEPLAIKFSATSGGQVNFDNITLETRPVPEPLTILGTTTALGFGVLFQRKNTFNKEAK